ncbi:MAG: hypothetical protein Q9O62_14710, partial [Ardenticatenia bacterium]|nr:hypothetical protein [Ardenticatenia bacterium]
MMSTCRRWFVVWWAGWLTLLAWKLVAANPPATELWRQAVWSRAWRLHVVDADTGAPLPGAVVETPYGTRRADVQGVVSVLGVYGARVRASTPGYELAEIALRADSQAIRLRSLRPRVHVVDARTGMPVAGAVVVWNGQWARTDDRGVVFLPAVPQGPLTVKRAAYWRAVVSSPETATLVRLEPIRVRGLYLAFVILNRPRTVIEAYLDRAARLGSTPWSLMPR